MCGEPCAQALLGSREAGNVGCTSILGDPGRRVTLYLSFLGHMVKVGVSVMESWFE